MLGEQIKPDLEAFVRNVGNRNGYHGNKISKSVMDMWEIEVRENGAGVLVPYWMGVLEWGRGPRLKNKDHKLYLKIKAWMAKRGMLKGTTEEQRDNEAKRLTWYINRYGNQQYNLGNRIFVDVYRSEREKTIEAIGKKFFALADKITKDVI